MKTKNDFKNLTEDSMVRVGHSWYAVNYLADSFLIISDEDGEEFEIEYEGRTYNRFKPCKYKCGYFTSWATDYKKGDKILHINPVTREIIGFNCPKFAEGSK